MNIELLKLASQWLLLSVTDERSVKISYQLHHSGYSHYHDH